MSGYWEARDGANEGEGRQAGFWNVTWKLEVPSYAKGLCLTTVSEMLSLKNGTW